MKKYIITQEDREEILNNVRARNYSSVRNALNQLPELEENKKSEEILNKWFYENFEMDLIEENKEQDIECKIKDFLDLLKRLKR